MKLKADVDIIIMSYNRLECLKRCLKSLEENTEMRYNLIIVDAGSKDKSRDWLFDNYLHKATLLFEEFRFSYAQSNNNAIRQSRGKYIALLNDDCEVKKGWLKKCVDAMEEDNSIGHACHVVLRADGKSIMSAGANLDKIGNTTVPLNHLDYYDEQNKEKIFNPSERNYAYGGFGVYRRDILEKVGYLPEFPCIIYWDDTDYGMKVNALGYDVRLIPDSVIVHYLEHSGREMHPLSLNVGRRYFLARWGEFLAENEGYNPSDTNTSKPYLNGKKGAIYEGETYNPFWRNIEGIAEGDPREKALEELNTKTRVKKNEKVKVCVVIASEEEANLHRAFYDGFAKNKKIETIKFLFEKPLQLSKDEIEKKNRELLRLYKKERFDFLIVVGGFGLLKKYMDDILCRKICWHIDDPYITKNKKLFPNIANMFNKNYTTSRKALEIYKENDIDAEYLPFNFNFDYHYPSEEPKKYDACFIGTAYKNREVFLNELIRIRDKKELNIYIAGCSYKGFNEGRISHKKTAEIMRQSKICVNFSDQPDGFLDAKNRIPEVMASGSYLLTQDFDHIEDYLPKSLCGVFETKEEMMAMIELWARYDSERNKLAKKAYGIAMNNFTCEKIACQILKNEGFKTL
jgi:hypothetical protein